MPPVAGAPYHLKKGSPEPELGSAEAPICLDDTLEDDGGANATGQNEGGAIIDYDTNYFEHEEFCNELDQLFGRGNLSLAQSEMPPAVTESGPTAQNINTGLSGPAIGYQSQNSGYHLRPRFNNSTELPQPSLRTEPATGYDLRSRVNYGRQGQSPMAYDLRSRSNSNIEIHRNFPSEYALRSRTNDIGNNYSAVRSINFNHPAGDMVGDVMMGESRIRRRRTNLSPSVINNNMNSVQLPSSSMASHNWNVSSRSRRRRNGEARGNNPYGNRMCPPLLRARVGNARSPNMPPLLSPEIMPQSINSNPNPHPNTFLNFNQVPVPVPFSGPTSIYGSNVMPNTAVPSFRANIPVYAPFGNVFPNQSHHIQQQAYGLLNLEHQSGMSHISPMFTHPRLTGPYNTYNYFRNDNPSDSFLENRGVEMRSHGFAAQLPHPTPFINASNRDNLFLQQNPPLMSDSFILTNSLSSRTGQQRANPAVQQENIQSQLNLIFNNRNVMPSSMDSNLEYMLVPIINGQVSTNSAVQPDAAQSLTESTFDDTNLLSTDSAVQPDVARSLTESTFNDTNLLSTDSAAQPDVARTLTQSILDGPYSLSTDSAVQPDVAQGLSQSTLNDTYSLSTDSAATSNESERIAELYNNYVELMILAERIDEERPGGLDRLEISQIQARRFKPEDSNEQLTCVICMAAFGRNQLIRTLRCSHQYHAKCVDRWFKTNRTCPVCRRDAAE